MRYNDGQTVFRTLLAEAGLDQALPPFLPAWQVYKHFAALPIVEELPTRDGILFSCDNEEKYFYLCFNRQMSRAYHPGRGDDEYGADVETMEELFVSFLFPCQQSLEYFELDSWNCASLEDFFHRIEQSAVFTVTRSLELIGFSISQCKLY